MSWLILLACLPGDIPPCTQCAANDDLDGDGYTVNGGDCDDGDAAVRPGADEVCNERDDDCNGLVDDEALDALTWYLDDDGDGYAGTVSELSCLAPSADWRPSTQDCDDTDAAVNPHADEICSNGVDDDCDGEATECVQVGAFAASGLPAVDLDGDGRVASLGDGDGDGYDDLLVAPTDQPVLAVISGASGWSGAAFADATGWLEHLTVSGLAGGHDLDGDGAPDALVSGADGLGLLAGGATGSIGPDETIVLDANLGAALALGDLDGDGAADVAIGQAGGAWVVPGPLTASGALSGDELLGDEPDALAVVDLDGDGFGELLVGDATTGVVVVVPGPPDPALAFDEHPALVGPEAGAGATLATADDLDGDGLSDLLVGDPEGSRAWVWTGAVTSDSSLDDGLAITGDTDEQAGASLGTPDLDGDGSPDLAIGAPRQGAAAPFYAPATSGTLSFADADLVVVGDTGLGASLATLDLDGDGFDELALGGEIRVLFGAGL